MDEMMIGTMIAGPVAKRRKVFSCVADEGSGSSGSLHKGTGAGRQDVARPGRHPKPGTENSLQHEENPNVFGCLE
jgi:hypothetical protein